VWKPRSDILKETTKIWTRRLTFVFLHTKRQETKIGACLQLLSEVRSIIIYVLMSASVWIKSKTLTKSLSVLNVSTYWLNIFHQGSWLFASCPQRLHEVCDDNTVYVRTAVMPCTSLATCPSSLVWKQCWLILEAASIYDVIRPVLSRATLSLTPAPFTTISYLLPIYMPILLFITGTDASKSLQWLHSPVYSKKIHRSKREILFLFYTTVHWEIFMTPFLQPLLTSNATLLLPHRFIEFIWRKETNCCNS
jgi:hypothetical protein